MSDRSALAEALASFDRYEAIRQQERPGDGHPFMYQVVAAARRVLEPDLQAMWEVLRASGCAPTVGLCQRAFDAALGTGASNGE